MENSKKIEQLKQVTASISKEFDADILLYNGDITRPNDRLLIESVNNRNIHKNIFLILVTSGGDSDAAYRISRFLQQKYENFFIYISGYCKSAGTLIALGASEVIMSDCGELGPLDIQLAKTDELFEMSSGLTVMNALQTLQAKTFSMFEHYFVTLKAKSGGQITLKTAMEIASDLTKGMLGRIYQQIEPNYLGEVARALNISSNYGNRLNKKYGNLKSEAIEYLTAAYPAHGFVIDQLEANDLFKKIRKPTENESILTECLGELAYEPSLDDTINPMVKFLSEEAERKVVINENDNKKDTKKNTRQEGEGIIETTGNTREKPSRNIETKSKSIPV